ncbi:ABC transporter family substrate-binding protein [Propionicicella superfundia]|uniref:ABC transporter family substrate-binding protein n=1 Tax=Propionicicella superfundia TaxID=348582 RepID=UPI00040AC4BC|nr:ABC transporter family substrate-binding protein [Propionicicella superfundia]
MKLNRWLATLLSAGLVLGLAACGGSPGNTDSPGTTEPTSGWDINEQDRGNLAEGGEFRGSVQDFAANWNPFNIEGSGDDYSLVRDAIRAHFFDYDSEGTPVANSDYIADVQTVNSPNTIVTLKMNPAAVWGDGTAITAADWIATWNAMNGKNTEFRAVSTQGWASVSEVKQGADEREVVFTFDIAYPDWTQVLSSGPLRKESCATPEAFNNGWSELKNEYFAGPFKVDSVDETQKIITLVPNDKWWGAKPLLTKITWRVVSADSVTSAFQSNELDYLDVGVDADAYSRVQQVGDAEVRNAGGPDFRQFTFNSKGGFLTDEKVRQAIVMGLDRTAIAASDLAGLNLDVSPLNNNIFMSNQSGYVDMAAKTGIDYNVDKAKALLEEAGWTLNSSSGYYEKNGDQLDVRFKQLTGVAASENEALQAQQMLKQIGVNLKIESVSADSLDEKLLSGGDWDIIAFSWYGSPYPFAGVRQLYGTDSQSNFAKLSISGLDDLLDKLDSETDPAARTDLANQAAEKIWTAVHTLPLYQRPDLVAVKKNLANFGSMGFGSVKWENVGYLK